MSRRTISSTAIAIIASLIIGIQFSLARRYRAHDHVGIVANTVGPFNNPTETYPFYSLPFCSGTGRQRRHKQDLGETLSGSRKVATPYELTFLDPVPWRSLCEEYLDAEDIKEFKDAIEADYFFEMLIDELPMWGYLGEVVHEEFLLGKSIQGARVVTANVTTDAKRRVDITDITSGQEVVFSYTVEWIHWLSVVNSIVLVLLLMFFLAIILMRILKNDFSKYMEIDEE
eukprot:gene38600-52145_t